MLLGAGIALTAAAGAALFFFTRLKQHLQRNLETAIGQQTGLSRRLTDIIIQLQQNQSKQDEQIQKLAEFAVHLKKEMGIVVQRQLDDEAEAAAPVAEKTRYLN